MYKEGFKRASTLLSTEGLAEALPSWHLPSPALYLSILSGACGGKGTHTQHIHSLFLAGVK